MEHRFKDDDSISLSSGVPSGSFVFDDACSDDTDFLIAQNLSLRESNDERSSTTTDLLYQTPLYQYAEEEEKSIPSAEPLDDTRFLGKNYSSYSPKQTGGNLECQKSSPCSTKLGTPSGIKETLSNSMLEKFTNLHISSPIDQSRTTYSSTIVGSSFTSGNTKKTAYNSKLSIREETLHSGEGSSNYSKEFLSSRSFKSMDASNNSKEGMQKMPAEEKKVSPGMENSRSPSSGGKPEKVDELVDQKVAEGQKILAALFSKAEHDQKREHEARLQRVRQWTLTEHQAPLEEKPSIWAEVSPQHSNFVSKRSPARSSGRESFYSDGKRSSCSASPQNPTPRVTRPSSQKEKTSMLNNGTPRSLKEETFGATQLFRSTICGGSRASSDSKGGLEQASPKSHKNSTTDLDSGLGHASDTEYLNNQKQDLVTQISEAWHTVRRLQSDIQSLEQLADQHRKQTVAARSELMTVENLRDEAQSSLDKLRNQIREEINLAADERVMQITEEKIELERKLSRLINREEDVDFLDKECSNLKQKLKSVQENLAREQEKAREAANNLNRKLEEERSKVRELQIEKTNAIRSTREELQEVSETEKNEIIQRLNKEKAVEIELIETKWKRESDIMAAQLKEKDFKIESLQDDLKRAEEGTKESSERLHELEMAAVMKNERLEELSHSFDETKLTLGKQVSELRQREADLNRKLKNANLESQTNKDRVARLEQKLADEKWNSQQLLKSKNSEIESLQTMLGQGEESSRLFGERMRKEAKGMVQAALAEERETHVQEVAQLKYKIEQLMEEREAAQEMHSRELQHRSDDIRSLQATVEKQKKEIEECKRQSFEAQEQRVVAVNNARAELKEEISRLKERSREMEKKDKSAALEIAEECMKISVLIGSSVKRSSWISSPDKSAAGTASSEAVKLLKQHLDDLKVHFMNLKRGYGGYDNEAENGDLNSSNQSLASLLLEKDDTISKLERQMKEMEKQFREERMMLENKHKETLENVEKEIKSLSSDGNGIELLSTPKSSDRTPRAMNGSVEESSTTKLLRHLQGRVKQLRAQNQSLKYSDDESFSSEQDSTSSLSLHDLAVEQSPVMVKKKIYYLEQALKKAEDYGHRNASLLNQKMGEMTKLQRMLTHANKENMKLERAHANLQQRLAEILAK